MTEREKQLAELVLYLTTEAYISNENCIKKFNLNDAVENIQEKDVTSFREKINQFIKGAINNPVEEPLERLIKNISERGRVRDKSTFITSLHLNCSMETDVDYSKYIDSISSGMSTIGFGDFSYKEYAEFLSLNINETTNMSIKYLIAISKEPDKLKGWEIASFKKVVDFSEKIANRYPLDFDIFKDSTISAIDIVRRLTENMDKLLRASDYKEFDFEYPGETICNCCFYIYKIAKTKQDAFQFLLELKSSEIAESIDYIYGRGPSDLDYLFDEETRWVFKHEYINFCYSKSISKSEVFRSIIDGGYKLTSIVPTEKPYSENEALNAIKVFLEYCSYCNLDHLKYIFLGKGSNIAYSKIQWNGSERLFRFAVHEIYQVIYKRRIPNGGWVELVKNFTDKDGKMIYDRLKSSSANNKSKEMLDFEKKIKPHL